MAWITRSTATHITIISRYEFDMGNWCSQYEATEAVYHLASQWKMDIAACSPLWHGRVTTGFIFQMTWPLTCWQVSKSTRSELQVTSQVTKSRVTTLKFKVFVVKSQASHLNCGLKRPRPQRLKSPLLPCLFFMYLNLWKIIKFISTRCQILRLKAPDPSNIYI